jgi:plasmid stability protein
MASITIRNLDDDLKRRLRVRAAKKGRSMEEEVREILRMALATAGAPRNLGQSIHDRFAALGGINLLPIQREPGSEAGVHE